MADLIQGQKYRIVGLGTMLGDEVCTASKTKATGYIEYQDDMLPVNLNLFGEGRLGEYATYRGKTKDQ